MAYTALYRRLRPKTFGQLLGQEHISRTLCAAIKQDNFVHAYLFCGPRGTGKTSSAKIFARAINCLDNQAGEPCGLCTACLRNLEDNALDIMEIDAASNRGIDEIRDLRERVKYAPAQDKYKVYIIDEVHMLTVPAFNALLKTLEEPPAHVIFVLATTEPHKIPLTILSRCQRFDFRRIGDQVITDYLQQIADDQNYQSQAEALALIAQKAEGGLRDALSLLDQCAAFADGRIDLEVVSDVLGMAKRELLISVTAALIANDLEQILAAIDNIYNQGLNLRQFVQDLLIYQRQILLQLLAGQNPNLPFAVNSNQLIRLLQTLSEADNRLRNSLQPRLSLELSLLQAANQISPAQNINQAPARPMAAPVAAATTQAAATTAKPAQAMPPKVSPAPARPKPAAAAQNAALQPEPDQIIPAREANAAAAKGPEAKPNHQINTDQPPQTAAMAEDIPANNDDQPQTPYQKIIALWPKIEQAVYKEHPGTAAFLAKAQVMACDQQKLVLGFAPEHKLFKEYLCKIGPAQKMLAAKITAIYGQNLQIEGIDLPSSKEPEKKAEPQKPLTDQDLNQGELF